MNLTVEHLITLMETPKIGRVSAKYIVENANFRINSLHDLLDLINELKKNNKRLPSPSFDDLLFANNRALEILDHSDKNEIRTLPYYHDDYSNMLLKTADYPLLMYLKGNQDLFNQQPCVAVIGTRQPSEMGVRLGERLTQVLVENNIIIASGLAIGCDSVAHQTCINHNGQTIAVMACGLDSIYPRENRKLAFDILENGGLWISEYSIGTKPRNNFFVERDRLQSGISNGICVIETDIKGGTMHTVGFAEKQNRLISCINHPEQHRNHSKVNGNQMLIRNQVASPLGNTFEIQDFINRIKQSSVQKPPSTNKNSDQLKIEL